MSSVSSVNDQNKQRSQIVIHTKPKKIHSGDLFDTVIEDRSCESKDGVTYYIGYSSGIVGPMRREDGNDRYIYLPLGEIKGLVNLIWDYLIESGQRYADPHKENMEEQQRTDGDTPNPS